MISLWLATLAIPWKRIRQYQLPHKIYASIKHTKAIRDPFLDPCPLFRGAGPRCPAITWILSISRQLLMTCTPPTKAKVISGTSSHGSYVEGNIDHSHISCLFSNVRFHHITDDTAHYGHCLAPHILASSPSRQSLSKRAIPLHLQGRNSNYKYDGCRAKGQGGRFFSE